MAETKFLKFTDDKKLELLKKYFLFDGSSIFAAPNQDGKPYPIEVGNVDDALEWHIKGRSEYKVEVTSLKSGKTWLSQTRKLGAYVVLGESARFLVIDIDGGADHKYSLKDPFACCLDLEFEAASLNLKVCIEKSFGGGGWHLWCLFDKPVNAREVREIGLYIARKSYPLLKGGESNTLRNQGVEVFPKQTKVETTKFGNLIWLPWSCLASSGNNQFYSTGGDNASN